MTAQSVALTGPVEDNWSDDREVVRSLDFPTPSDIERAEPSEFDSVVSVEVLEGLPVRLIELYADAAVRHARMSEVDPGVWVANVVGLDGAMADGDSADEAMASLREAVIGWVVVKRQVGATDIPVIDGFDLNPSV